MAISVYGRLNEILYLLKYKELAKKIILKQNASLFLSPQMGFCLISSFVAYWKLLRCSYFRLENYSWYSKLKENLNLLNYIY